MSRTARDVALVGLCWAAARIIALYSLGFSPTIAFDEAQYLEESFLLATGAPAVFYKGPFVYGLAAAGMLFAPGRLGAVGVAVLMDLALVFGFWLSVRRDDRMTALAGSLLLAACPLAAWFSLHLLTDVPLALFSFLCVHAFCRRVTTRARIESAAWLVMALLVKSTAILLLPILAVCALLLRLSWRTQLVPFAAGVAVYLALPLVWRQTSDATFIRALPWMSLRCGVLYFPMAALVAAGPVMTILGAARVARRGLGSAAIGSLCALVVLAGTYTLFGDPQPKYVVTLAPFLALLAGQILARARGMLIAVCVAAAMTGIVPVVRLMEEDGGMSAVARYLRSLPVESVRTTIPVGVHRHAFAGALRFSGALEEAPPLRDVGSLEAPMAIWTDYTGAPEELERRLDASGEPWLRLDFYTNRNTRPVYLVGLEAPAPERLRWEPNLLMSPLVTPLDRAVQDGKRALWRRYQPSRNE